MLISWNLYPVAQVPESDIENYAREHGIEYFETSAKTGDNVENTFLHVC